jgi:hypothetical protein
MSLRDAIGQVVLIVIPAAILALINTFGRRAD